MFKIEQVCVGGMPRKSLRSWRIVVIPSVAAVSALLEAVHAGSAFSVVATNRSKKVAQARMAWETLNSGSDSVGCFSAIDSRRALTRCS